MQQLSKKREDSRRGNIMGVSSSGIREHSHEEDDNSIRSSTTCLSCTALPIPHLLDDDADTHNLQPPSLTGPSSHIT